MNKTIHFISGLPRSGSTLLCNILMQNPRFHATSTSGITEVLMAARNIFSTNTGFLSMQEKLLDTKTINVMRGILYGFFGDVERPVCFEKSRGVEAHLEMYEAILGRRPKVLCCVRDVREVLASFEKLTWKTRATRQLPDERITRADGMMNFWTFETCVQRCQWLLRSEGGIVGTPINRIREAPLRGWRHTETGNQKDADIFFVDYENLTAKPSKTMEKIYDFIGEPQFKHDFDNVEQVVVEDDLVHVYKDLHTIRRKVEPQESSWSQILPKDYALTLEPDAKFWTKLQNWK
jgi:sulfotransferase